MKAVLTFLLLSLALPVLAQSPSRAHPAGKRFIAFIITPIKQANARIGKQRRILQQLQRNYTRQGVLTVQQIQQFKRYSRAFALPLSKSWKQAPPFRALLKRIDTLPNSLIIAQAINESAWGRSRFARLGNNYFGQWCYTLGCGLVPKARPATARYEVRRFTSVQDSVQAYLHNINTSRAYRVLRTRRALMRRQHQMLDSVRLAQSLQNYSQKRSEYARLITQLIKRYHLQAYDV